MDLVYFLLKAPLFLAGCVMLIAFVASPVIALYQHFGPVGGSTATATALAVVYGWWQLVVVNQALTSPWAIGLSVPVGLFLLFVAALVTGGFAAALTHTMPKAEESQSQ